MTRRRRRSAFLLVGLGVALFSATGPLAAAPAATPESGGGVVPRIVGGAEVDPPGSYPFVVALVLASESDAYRGFYCGGALIAAEWVLTAGHCVGGAFDVLVGRHDLSDDTQGERIGVSAVYRHPSYAFPVNDLALVRLERAATAGSPVGLATAADAPWFAAGTMATVAGWGLTMGQPPGTPEDPTTLRAVNLPIVSDDDCKAIYPGFFTPPGMICAGDLAVGGVDACPGDSGGPLFVTGPSGHLHVGIVSGGMDANGCGVAGQPTFYTETAAYQEWIASVVSGAPPPPPAETPTCQARPASIVGTAGDDVLLGTAGLDVIAALEGNDRVYGRGGDDLICLGPGNDEAYGGPGDDLIRGEAGADLLGGNGGADRLLGGPGPDTLLGGVGGDRLAGGSGADSLLGGAGPDTVLGGTGDDELHGQGGRDVLRGGAGIDTCHTGEDVVHCRVVLVAQ